DPILMKELAAYPIAVRLQQITVIHEVRYGERQRVYRFRAAVVVEDQHPTTETELPERPLFGLRRRQHEDRDGRENQPRQGVAQGRQRVAAFRRQLRTDVFAPPRSRPADPGGRCPPGDKRPARPPRSAHPASPAHNIPKSSRRITTSRS